MSNNSDTTKAVTVGCLIGGAVGALAGATMLKKASEAGAEAVPADIGAKSRSAGEFDAQGSEYDFDGALYYMPPSGFVNNCDGGRSGAYCDYRQQ